MNKTSRWLGSFVAVSLFIRLVVNASALAQDAPQTPEPNSSERKAIMNTLRVPVEKELKQKIVFRIRRLKMQNGWAFLEGVPQEAGGKQVNYTITPDQTAFRGMETNGNPWGISAASRADWAKDLPVVTLAEAGETPVEVLFWVGCAGSYEDRARRVSRSLVEILNAAGVSFAILGTEETCNGDSARRMGNEYLFQVLAQQNIETLNGYGVKKIVTNCPHCFNCLKNEYAPLGGHYEVTHGTELVSKLIEDGRIALGGEIPQTITFHDPCYLGRYNGVYDAPRRILEAIPGLRLQELPRSRERGLCCGAGGGRMWMEEKLGSRINQTRMREISQAGTDAVGVSCPFCMVMIGNAKEEIGATTQPFDVLELARRAMSSVAK